MFASEDVAPQETGERGVECGAESTVVHAEGKGVNLEN